MKIIEYTYPDSSRSYSSGGATIKIDNVSHVSQAEYEVDDTLGQLFLDNPTAYTFEKGVINAK